MQKTINLFSNKEGISLLFVNEKWAFLLSPGYGFLCSNSAYAG